MTDLQKKQQIAEMKKTAKKAGADSFFDYDGVLWILQNNDFVKQEGITVDMYMDYINNK